MENDLKAQLAQVQARIVERLAERQTAANKGYSASTRRLIEQSLHGLYVLEYDISQDLAKIAA